MGKTILFVYGTLKRGEPAHRLLADQTFLGDAVTLPGYRLYDLGRYPGLVAAADGPAVHGELWAVSACCLEELDDYEGAPELFRRGPIGVEGWDGVEAYFYARPIPVGDRWPM